MSKRVETPQEYVQRILGNLKGQDPMEVLGATAGRLRGYLRETPIEVLRRRPAPDKWSAVEIIAHLADIEIVIGWRFRLILAHDGVAVQAFDQDEWVRNLRYQDTDPAEAVDHFESAREANLQLLRRVEPSRLENYGVHPERGRETVAQLIRLFAGHDLNHLAQLESLVSGHGSLRPQ
ncbi:MAG: DinB family protein [Gemmatimonadota bacterium]|nr:DinB family protein [Gemmatimonadota bacterium]